MALTAVADNVNGKVAVGWNNPVAQKNRIYFRPNGVSPTPAWVLLKDNIAGTIGANSIDLYDNVPVGIALDFSITGINNSSGAETSPNSAVISNVTIKPDYHWDKGGWNCMIHMVGAGATYKAGLMIQPPIKVTQIIDSEIANMFGNQAPSVRYGLLNYLKFELDLLPRPSQDVYNFLDVPAVGIYDLTSLENLQTVLNAIQTNAGIICLRNTYGDIYYCAIDPEQRWEHDLYQKYTIKLVQLQYIFTP